MPNKYAICKGTSSLAYYEGETAEEALARFLRDKLHALTLLDLVEPGGQGQKAPPGTVLHGDNGCPAELTFGGETYYAVPV